MIRRLAVVALGGALIFWACDSRQNESIELSEATQPIQGGTLDTTSNNVVGIVLQSGGICSGSLIAPNLVLTARHCVADATITTCASTSTFGATFSTNEFRVTPSGTAGASLNFWPSIDNKTWFGVSEVYLPTNPANSICGGDIALLRLSANVKGICPLVPRVDKAVSFNESVTAIGLGITSPGGMTFGMRYTVSGLYVSCAQSCGPTTSPLGEWIAGANSDIGACQGDSGGPALDSKRRVIGIVSRGPENNCGDTVYESVFAQASLIKNAATQAATQGGYSPAAWVTGGSTDTNPCMDSGSGGGAGGGGGSTGGGAGGGAQPSNCPSGTSCVDLSGQGGLACVSAGNSVPAGAPSCATSACPSGYSCWQPIGAGRVCLKDCSFGATGGGGGNTGTGGGNSIGGGTGSTGGGAGPVGGGSGGGSVSSTPIVFALFSQQNHVAPNCSVTAGSAALWLAVMWGRRKTRRGNRGHEDP